MTSTNDSAFLPRKALIVREPWISAILDGTKLWELRGSRTQHRGPTSLISSGTGLVFGQADLIDVRGPLDHEELKTAATLHRVPLDMLAKGLPYRQTFAWIFSDARRFKAPTPYAHPKGAVIWVDLERASSTRRT